MPQGLNLLRRKSGIFVAFLLRLWLSSICFNNLAILDSTFMMSRFKNRKQIQKQLGFLFMPNDFSVLTWLAIGGCTWQLMSICIPPYITSMLLALYLVLIASKTVISSRQIFTGSFVDVKRGRWTTKLSNLKKGSEEPKDLEGVVIFVLGTRLNQ
jgi:hypothetical protein